MSRKAIILLGLLGTAVPSFAGYYLGGSVGPEGASFTKKSHVWQTRTFDVIDKNHFAGTGVFGSIFGGYEWVRNQYYLAAEINGNISSVQHKLENYDHVHSNLSVTTSTVKNSAGISLLPGYFLSQDTLAYGRLGYVNGHLRIRESDPTIPSFGNHVNGIRYGVGVRHRLSPRWSAMLDYSQIHYNLVKGSTVSTDGGSLTNPVFKETIFRAYTAQVGLGMIYHFDAPEPTK